MTTWRLSRYGIHPRGCCGRAFSFSYSWMIRGSVERTTTRCFEGSIQGQGAASPLHAPPRIPSRQRHAIFARGPPLRMQCSGFPSSVPSPRQSTPRPILINGKNPPRYLQITSTRSSSPASLDQPSSKAGRNHGPHLF